MDLQEYTKSLITNKLESNLSIIENKAKKLMDGEKLTVNIKLNVTHEESEFAFDGKLSTKVQGKPEKDPIEFCTFDPDQPDMFDENIEYGPKQTGESVTSLARSKKV